MKPLLLLSFVVMLAVTAWAYDQSERDSNGSKGKVKTVENYETVFWGPDDRREHGTRNLRGLSIYNRKGDLTEMWSLTNDSNGSYYERRTYTYGDHHRKLSAKVYRSDRSGPQIFFSLNRTSTVEYEITPLLKEWIMAKIDYIYDEKGRLVEERTMDAADAIIQRDLMSYDDAGNTIKFQTVRTDGLLVYEALSLFFDDRSETTWLRDGGTDIQRSVTWKDKNGAAIKEEQYILAQPNAPPTSRSAFRLANRMTQRFQPDRVDFEWMFFNPDGQPGSKLIWSTVDGQVRSRERFVAGTLPPGSRNENIEPVWITDLKESHEYEFDKKGNVTKHVWQEQKPGGPWYTVYVFDNTITYF